MSLHALNQQFSVAERIDFSEVSGLPMVRLRHREASATVCLQGAQVVSYQPCQGAETFWVSDSARYEAGISIRGGIPVCWPWFGPHPDMSDFPKHGYARNSIFDVVSVKADDDAVEILVRLSKTTDPAYAVYADLELEVCIRLSDDLHVELVTTNNGSQTIPVTSALHNYFQISDVSNVSISELSGKKYLDKLQGYAQETQTERFGVSSPVDRVFQGMSEVSSLILDDSGRMGNAVLSPWGAENMVVWNPWEEGAKHMDDFDDHGYRTMLCVEPANALKDAVDLPAGNVHRMGQKLSIQQ